MEALNVERIEVGDLEKIASLRDAKRKFNGLLNRILQFVCVSMVLYQLYIASFGDLLAIMARAIHLGFGMTAVFMMYPVSAKLAKQVKIPIYDWLFVILSLAANGYLVIFNEDLAIRAGTMTTTDLVMGIILIVLLLESARRVVGKVLTSIALFFIIYVLFGNYFPGPMAYRGASLESMVRYMYTTTEGVYGTILGVSCNFIFLFILMGSLMTVMGTGEFLMDISLAVFGKYKGGPAKAVILASALFGMISGSTVANIVTVGTFTIPLMKKVGYKPHFAGSIEATASCGGQIMPPVMGAAAFIIAENLGVSYLKVCAAAALPAILYFTSIYFAVHQEAVRENISGLPKEQLPKAGHVLKTRGYLILPLFIIVGMLLGGFSPAMSGFTATLSCVALSFIRRESWLTPKRLVQSSVNAVINALEVLIACATVGFIVGAFTMTGLGVKLATLVVTIGGGYLLPTLIMTGICCIILGMGVPTTANYVMMSMITVPAVLQMGVPAMAAHLFCFYYGIISDLTPPVALGALAGAGIAQANFWKTGLNAMKLACPAYIVPFFIVYNPILLVGQQPFTLKLLLIVAFCVFGVLVLSCALYRYIIDYNKFYETILCYFIAFMCIHPNILYSFIGIGLFVLVIIAQRDRIKKSQLLTCDNLQGK